MLWRIRYVSTSNGYYYAWVPDHPNASGNGFVFHHRLVVECYLGRALTEDEVVHHVDGGKRNNVLANLALMLCSEHAAYHAAKRGKPMVRLRCLGCGNAFEQERRKTHLSISSKRFTCCSRGCGTRLSYKIRKTAYVLTDAEITNSVLAEYRYHAPVAEPQSVLETHAGAEAANALAPLVDVAAINAAWRVSDERLMLFGRRQKQPRPCARCKKPMWNEKYCSYDCAAASVRTPFTSDELARLVWEMPTTKVAAHYGVSDVAVAKWCKKHAIKKPPRGYWAKKAAGKI